MQFSCFESVLPSVRTVSVVFLVVRLLAVATSLTHTVATRELPRESWRISAQRVSFLPAQLDKVSGECLVDRSAVISLRPSRTHDIDSYAT